MESKASAARSDLEQMLVDETAQPKPLPLSLLEDITDDFSYDREIGSGGFAVVYKGILGDRAVAVKRISNALMDETKFHKEVECLMRVKHKNVVRFLGYCDDRQGNMERYDGKFVMADVHQRLLCFEYMPAGSLDNYIIDAYRDWGTCYKIIKEICEGLQFLHENNIIHLDMKPANILLDNNMTPKITDFGLSRRFDESQSREITQTRPGTLGYLAPELADEGVIARSADLYSLGVIIIEILTGQKRYQAIEDVLESWSDRLERSQRDIQVEQIRVCYKIAYECKEFNPKKRPASAQNIIDKLHEMESTQTVSKSAIGFVEVGILGAHGLAGMKNPYVVAKYDEKWVRTRTLINTTAPKWNEQYSWDVFDQSTVIVVAVFDACHLGGHNDQPIGNVRLSLAALQNDRVYTHHYPLNMELSPSGLNKTGELHLHVLARNSGHVRETAAPQDTPHPSHHPAAACRPPASGGGTAAGAARAAAAEGGGAVHARLGFPNAPGQGQLRPDQLALLRCRCHRQMVPRHLQVEEPADNDSGASGVPGIGVLPGADPADGVPVHDHARGVELPEAVT